MKNLSLLIDPVTKDYKLDANGDPMIDEGLKTPAYFRLSIKRTQWLHAPNDQYGSDLYLLKKNPTAGDGSAFSNTANKALDPLIQQQRADLVDTVLTDRSRYGVGMQINIKEIKTNELETMFFPIART